jgi:FKBP-type peptidyl-prolyl cis-trans isomerase 2
MKVKKGDTIQVEYTGTLDDGTVFDATEGKEPLEFEVGAGQVIPGFDSAVLGMDLNEEKEFRIEKEDAYGDVNPSLLKKIPKKSLPQGKEPKAGMALILKTPDGQQVPVKIADVSETDITLDLNHPLAGQALTFKIKLVGIL